MFESDGVFYVGVMVVDSGGDGKELVVDGLSFFVVMSFIGFKECKEKFWSNIIVIDEYVVDVESSVEEVFVVVSENVDVGLCFFDDRDFLVLLLYVFDIVFYCKGLGDFFGIDNRCYLLVKILGWVRILSWVFRL